MRRVANYLFIIAILMTFLNQKASAGSQWIQPDAPAPDKPIWGIAGGISVGLWPTYGPRGLIRIYTPYLQQSDGRIMNFIAVEPIVAGRRGYSELEHSDIDKQPGRQMWTADEVDVNNPLPLTHSPARGVITRDGDAEILSFYILVERFENGAKPIVKISLRSDRPEEVSLKTFCTADSAPIESCVLTATMGNWARLRHLHLKDQTINSIDLFHDRPLDGMKFFHPVSWPADQLTNKDGDLVVSATGDLDQTTPAEVPEFWRYQGRPAIQTWRTASRPDIKARVTGRIVFWGSKVPVPGGAAFENFELTSPFEPGQEFRFGITPER
jgi:hypothetical protein